MIDMIHDNLTNPLTSPPIHTNPDGCDHCSFMGSTSYNDRFFDLYVCHGFGGCCLVARYSGDGPDYYSTTIYRHDDPAPNQYPLKVAYDRAKQLGVIPAAPLHRTFDWVQHSRGTWSLCSEGSATNYDAFIDMVDGFYRAEVSTYTGEMFAGYIDLGDKHTSLAQAQFIIENYLKEQSL